MPRDGGAGRPVPPRAAALAMLVTLSLVAVALGLAEIGGPGRDAAERRDARRLADLAAMAERADCLWQAGGGVPEGLSGPGEAACPEAPHRDPYTDMPYAYRSEAPHGYRLCARFEAPEALPETQSGRPVVGACLRIRRAPGGGA